MAGPIGFDGFPAVEEVEGAAAAATCVEGLPGYELDLVDRSSSHCECREEGMKPVYRTFPCIQICPRGRFSLSAKQTASA